MRKTSVLLIFLSSFLEIHILKSQEPCNGESYHFMDTTFAKEWKTDSFGLVGKRLDLYKKYFYYNNEEYKAFFIGKKQEYIICVIGEPNQKRYLPNNREEYDYYVKSRLNSSNNQYFIDIGLEIVFLEKRVIRFSFYLE